MFTGLRDLAIVARVIREHPLHTTGAQRRRAYARFLAWQVAGRAHPGPLVMDFVNDTQLLVKRRLGGRLHYVLGLAEFDDMAFVAHYLRADEMFADVGANIGAYSVMAAACAGARCAAFEPTPRAYRYLADNVALNRLGSQVELCHAAVGAAPGELAMTAGMGEVNHMLGPGEADAAGERVSVPVVTLDAFFAGRGSPSLVKVDVEGFETEVMRGADALLKHQPPAALLLELAGNGSRYGYDEAGLHAKILGHGYSACHYDGLRRSLTEHPAGWQPDGGNVLYLRDLEGARQRVREARAFRLGGRDI